MMAMSQLTGWRQGAKAPRRQSAMASEGSSSCSDLSSQQDQTTTTTTVVPRRQDAKAPTTPTLPLGPVGAVESKGSKYSLEENLTYARWSYENGTGVKHPEQFANSNFRTGKHDWFIEQWKKEQEKEPLLPITNCKVCGVGFRPEYEGGEHCKQCRKNDQSGHRR